MSKEKRETLRKKIVSLTLKKKSKITKVGHEVSNQFLKYRKLNLGNVKE